MKKHIPIVVILLLTSCSIKSYEYVLEMKKPNFSKELEFSDDKIKIVFDIGKSDISFALRNKTSSGIKILWDEASFVKKGEAQKIIHKNVKLIDKEKSQIATVIPPSSYIKDRIQPIDDIVYNTVYYGNKNQSFWSTKPFYPLVYRKNIDKIKPLKGTKLNIYLPIQSEGKLLEYYFEFEVVDILLRSSKINVLSLFKEE